MKKILFLGLIAATTLGTIQVNAQDKVKFTKEQLKMMDDDLFDEMFTGVSSKKTSTVILKDGRKIEGSASGIDRKKGQIYSIDIKDGSGKKTEYKAEDIAEMYLPISGMAKASKVNSYFGNSKNWGRKSLNKTTNPDEVYVKNVKASLKNKKEEKEFLMQLINPSFSSIIEVYADPNASETSSFSVGGSPSFGGGVTKSYYIKKGDEVLWLKKGDFEDHYAFMFGDNEEFMKSYPYKSIKWEQLSFLIAEYTKLSSEE
ncbi:hypothetical protein [Paenimyroides viscosum]|uniref:Uncharacterized protein n=1 Tax=Paenimyroides viscosum TaxID=2488729 RepID=A0A3P1B7N1_9FLAO|nr:hypothetical protein [Paenimyroides viscosum]RRA97075.1 hypothetical protein EG242_00685 [Paenimyroides viscosum]